MRPSGRNVRPHGFTSPSVTVTTLNATPSFCSGARVCPANAGFCPSPFGGRVFIPVSGPPPGGPPPRRPPCGAAGGVCGGGGGGCCAERYRTELRASTTVVTIAIFFITGDLNRSTEQRLPKDNRRRREREGSSRRIGGSTPSAAAAEARGRGNQRTSDNPRSDPCNFSVLSSSLPRDTRLANSYGRAHSCSTLSPSPVAFTTVAFVQKQFHGFTRSK